MNRFNKWAFIFIVGVLCSCDFNNLTCPFNRGNCSLENKNIALSLPLVKRDIDILRIFLENSLSKRIIITDTEIKSLFNSRKTLPQTTLKSFLRNRLKGNGFKIYFTSIDGFRRYRSSPTINDNYNLENIYTRFLQNNFRNFQEEKLSFDMYPLRTVRNLNISHKSFEQKDGGSCLLILPESRILVLF